MAALKIAPPCAAAFFLEQLFLSAAELIQIRVTRNDRFYVGRALIAAENNLLHQTTIRFPIGDRCVGIKFREFKKLLRGMGDDKTMLFIFRLRFTSASSYPS